MKNMLSADFMAHYLSSVSSEELTSMYFAIELLCIREHSWELSNTSMSFSVDEIDDLLFAVLLLKSHMFSSILQCTFSNVTYLFFACLVACLLVFSADCCCT